MKFSALALSFWEDFKAWRRGEKRVAPRGSTGRVYSRPGGGDGNPSRVDAAPRPKVTVSMVIIRAEK